MNKELKEYNIYAGLNGGFGGASYQFTSLFPSYEKAEQEAYYRSIEEFENYEGLHGLLTIQDFMDEEDVSESEAEEMYNEQVESWIDYYAVLTSEDKDTDEDELDRRSNEYHYYDNNTRKGSSN